MVNTIFYQRQPQSCSRTTPYTYCFIYNVYKSISMYLQFDHASKWVHTKCCWVKKVIEGLLYDRSTQVYDEYTAVWWVHTNIIKPTCRFTDVLFCFWTSWWNNACTLNDLEELDLLELKINLSDLGEVAEDGVELNKPCTWLNYRRLFSAPEQLQAH